MVTSMEKRNRKDYKTATNRLSHNIFPKWGLQAACTSQPPQFQSTPDGSKGSFSAWQLASENAVISRLPYFPGDHQQHGLENLPELRRGEGNQPLAVPKGTMVYFPPHLQSCAASPGGHGKQDEGGKGAVPEEVSGAVSDELSDLGLAPGAFFCQIAALVGSGRWSLLSRSVTTLHH